MFAVELQFGRDATIIINELHGINRVTYDVTGKPPTVRGTGKGRMPQPK